MRPAIMPISSFHSAKSSGRPTTMDAMRARALRSQTPCQAQLCKEGACADLQGCQSKVSASLSRICISHILTGYSVFHSFSSIVNMPRCQVRF